MESFFNCATGIMSWKFPANNEQTMQRRNKRDFSDPNRYNSAKNVPQQNRMQRVNHSQQTRAENNPLTRNQYPGQHRNQRVISTSNPYKANNNVRQRRSVQFYNQRDQQNKVQKDSPQNRYDGVPQHVKHLEPSLRNRRDQNRRVVISNEPPTGGMSDPAKNGPKSKKQLRNKIRRLKQKAKKANKMSKPDAIQEEGQQPLITIKNESDEDDLMLT